MPYCCFTYFLKFNFKLLKIMRVSLLKLMIFEINPLYLQG